MVRRHGGRVVDHPSMSFTFFPQKLSFANEFEKQILIASGFQLDAQTFVIIAGDPKSLRVTKFIASKSNNIAKPQWLVRALGSEEPLKCLIKFTPDDMVFATDKLQEEFAAESDIYDSCDTEPMDIDDELAGKSDNEPE